MDERAGRRRRRRGGLVDKTGEERGGRGDKEGI